MKIKILIIFLVLWILKIDNANSQSITIAAAADLRYALNEIKLEFLKKNPNVKIDIIYGSSGNLYQQIINKAPYDIYFSADIVFPKKIDSLKLCSTKPKLYAIGFLVLWTSKLDITKGINLLLDDKVKKIAIANPKHAPYGKRAIEFLKYYNFFESVKNKFVEGENISQAAQFVLTGNVEVGIIALSIALSPEMSNKGKYILLDEKSYSPLEQSYVVLKNSEKKADVMKFYNYIETAEAKKILSKYGFKLPN